jgi:erythromycin esterase
MFHGLEDVGRADSIPVLDDALRGVSLIGLGESVHASGGYHAARLNLVKYLVTHHGYRVILLETPIDDTRAAADYVTRGEGSAPTAVHTWYACWQSLESVQLLEWLRAYNVAHPSSPVHFSGFDIRQGDADVRFLESAQRAQPKDAGAALFRRALDDCPVPGDARAFFFLEKEIWDGKRRISNEEKRECLGALDELERYVRSSKSDPARRQELLWTLVHLNNLRSWVSSMAALATSTPRAADTERDRGLARNVRLLPVALTGAPAKAIYIAHNLHVAKAVRRLQSSEAGIANYVTMGEILEEEMGEAYRAVGLLAFEVGINWPGLQERPLWFREGPDTLESQLNGLSEPFLLLSPRAAPAEIPTEDRSFGTLFREDGPTGEPVSFRGNVGQQFDLVFFLRRSEALVPASEPPKKPG